MSVTPSDLDVQDAALRHALSNVHTCMPAEVLRVYSGAHKRQFVDVLPGLQRAVYDEDGDLVDEQLPILTMVPVGHLQAGGFYIALPIAVGDIVTLWFAERSLDHWIETAKKGSKRAVIPGDLSTHSLEGAIAVPCGPAPRSALLPDVSASELVIGGPAGVALRLKSDGSMVFAEGSGSAALALATKVATELDRIKTDFTLLKGAVAAGLTAVGVGASANGPAGATAFNSNASMVPSSPASVASSKITSR